MAKQINSASIVADLLLVNGESEKLGEMKSAYSNKAEKLAEDLGAFLKGKDGAAVDKAIEALQAEVAADPILGEKSKKGVFVMKAATRRHLERAVQSAIKNHGVAASDIRKAKTALAQAKAAQAKVANAAKTLGVDASIAATESFSVSANQKRLVKMMLENEAVEIAFTRLLEAAAKGSKSYGLSKDLIEACKPEADQTTVAAQLAKVAA